MIIRQLTDSQSARFTDPEMQRLCELKAGYQMSFDLFTERQKAKLGFLRWLFETGRLDS